MTYRNIFISFALMLVILFSVWTMFFMDHSRNLNTQEEKQLPDALMEEVTAITMNKQGQPTMKVVSPQIIHYAKEDTTYFTQPDITLYRKSPQPWNVTATHAKAIQGVDQINFWGAVTIHHPADQNNPTTLIKSPTLTVYLSQQIAETNDKITLIQPNVTINATGMQANMNTGEIKLLSEARGEYVPSS